MYKVKFGNIIFFFFNRNLNVTYCLEQINNFQRFIYVNNLCESTIYLFFMWFCGRDTMLR